MKVRVVCFCLVNMEFARLHDFNKKSRSFSCSDVDMIYEQIIGTFSQKFEYERQRDVKLLSTEQELFKTVKVEVAS